MIHNIDNLAEYVNKAVREMGITRVAVYREAKVHNTNHEKWSNGTYPNYRTILKIVEAVERLKKKHKKRMN